MFWGFLKSLFGGGISGAAGAVKGVAEVFTSNAEGDAQRSHQQHMGQLGYDASALQGAHAAYAAEWNSTRGATGFRGFLNAFVDLLNRLPRPLMALGVIGLFVFAAVDPVSATATFGTFSVIPLELWGIMSAIVAFFFGAREIEKFRSKPEDLEKRAKIAREIAAARKAEAEARKAEVDADEESSPSNPTVADWLRRNT